MLAQHGFRALEMAASDVYHRHLEMHEREIRVQVAGTGQRLQSLLAPRRVGKTKLIPPVPRLERNRASGSGQCLFSATGAHQQKR